MVASVASVKATTVHSIAATPVAGPARLHGSVPPPVLPTALHGWESALAFLDDDVVLGLGPLLRALQEAMPDGEAVHQPDGEPDGFDGISLRGEIDRLLVSEWALADELPEEFLRRFASAELQYLKRAYHAPIPPGAIVALADTGPDQLGAPRIVHLAVMLVLARRAQSRGSELRLGVLSDEPDDWISGSPESIIRAWITRRAPELITHTQVEARLAEIGSADHVWLLSNVVPRSSAVPVAFHRVAARETVWDDAGVTHVQVELDRRVLELALPPPATSIRVLRGNGFRPAAERTRNSNGDTAGETDESDPGRLFRFPVFAGSCRRLIMRGENANVLIAVTVPQGEQAPVTRPVRRHTFPGRVLAVCADSRRLVGLCENDGVVSVHTFGKSLGQLAKLSLPMHGQLGLDDAAVQRICSETLQPMFFQSGRLLVRVGETTFVLAPPHHCAGSTSALLAYWYGNDQPIVGTRHGDHLYASQLAKPIQVGPGETTFLAGCRVVAATHNGETWDLHATNGAHGAIGGSHIGRVELREGGVVKGVIRDPVEPWIVTLSEGAQIIRLTGPGSTKVLTEFSGDVEEVAVHPTEPLLAVQYRDRRVVLVDVARRKAILTVRPEPE